MQISIRLFTLFTVSLISDFKVENALINPQVKFFFSNEENRKGIIFRERTFAISVFNNLKIVNKNLMTETGLQ